MTGDVPRSPPGSADVIHDVSVELLLFRLRSLAPQEVCMEASSLSGLSGCMGSGLGGLSFGCTSAFLCSGSGSGVAHSDVRSGVLSDSSFVLLPAGLLVTNSVASVCSLSLSNCCSFSLCSSFDVARFVISAKPFTLRLSAVFSSADSWQYSTFTSPLYMNSTRVFSSENLTSLSITMGCRLGWSTNRVWKYEEQADKTTLCARIVVPSEQARVTSTRLSSRRSWLNTPRRLL